MKVIELEKDDTNEEKDKGQGSTNWEEIQKEAAIMRRMHHPNIVACFASFTVKTELWLVLPYLKGGSCADLMKSMKSFKHGFKDESIISTILHDVLQGIQYCHNDGRIHRDIKAANILLSADGVAQLSDFGVSGAIIEGGLRKPGRDTSDWFLVILVFSFYLWSDKFSQWNKKIVISIIVSNDMTILTKSSLIPTPAPTDRPVVNSLLIIMIISTVVIILICLLLIAFCMIKTSKLRHPNKQKQQQEQQKNAHVEMYLANKPENNINDILVSTGPRLDTNPSRKEGEEKNDFSNGNKDNKSVFSLI